MSLDHVLVPVSDLDAAARRFEEEYGLTAVEGGRHPGVGTANRIIPLGHTYVELIAVVDAAEAARFPRSRRVGEAAREGRPFATWAARTDDLEALRAALISEGWRLPPVNPGARITPDGTRLEWRTQELSLDLTPSVLPFLIEWRLPAGHHPGQVPERHRSGAGDIIFARFAAPDPKAASALLRSLTGAALEFDVVQGRAGLIGIELEAPAGRLAIP